MTYGPWRETGVPLCISVGRRVVTVGLTAVLVRFAPETPAPITSGEATCCTPAEVRAWGWG